MIIILLLGTPENYTGPFSHTCNHTAPVLIINQSWLLLWAACRTTNDKLLFYVTVTHADCMMHASADYVHLCFYLGRTLIS